MKYLRCQFLALALFIFGIVAQAKTLPVSQTESTTIPDALSDRLYQPFTGDLNEMRKRRIIRVLTTYSRTNFFMTPKGFRGIEYELLKAYERYLNKGPLKQRYQTQLIFLPTPFNELTQKLRQGYGDIAAAGLTITPERQALIDFTNPYITDINEHLVSAPEAPPIQNLKDLSGKTITVVAQSSYVIHLQRFNQVLGQLGLPLMEIQQAPPLLTIEDLLEMTDSGLIDYTVSDSHIAQLWQQVFPHIKVHKNMVFHYGGRIAWGIRHNNPQLKDSLNQFIQKYAKPGRLLSNILYKKYFEDLYWVQRAPTYSLLKKANCLDYYFKLYADFYDFDWTLIAAQAYQESRFNQNKRSHKGAIGIMQMKPSTARHMNIRHIDRLENNIEAGVKYLAFIRDRYFSGSEYSPEEQINFSLAAYNAGPAKIRKLQKQAKKQHLNPYKWFYNVETIARHKIGLETVNYVANIRKYQIAIQMSHALALKRLAFKKDLIQNKTPPTAPLSNALTPSPKVLTP